jgi:hypothetical protein
MLGRLERARDSSSNQHRIHMYKFVVISGSCGSPYSIAQAEQSANSMAQQGYVLDHVYQSSTTGCFGTSSALVMIFRPR